MLALSCPCICGETSTDAAADALPLRSSAADGAVCLQAHQSLQRARLSQHSHIRSNVCSSLQTEQRE